MLMTYCKQAGVKMLEAAEDKLPINTVSENAVKINDI